MIKNYVASARCRTCAEGKPADKPCLAVEMGDGFKATLCAAHLFALAELHDESARAGTAKPAEVKQAVPPTGSPTAVAGNGPTK